MINVNDAETSDEPNDDGHLCRQPGCEKWGCWGYDGGEGVSAWWCHAHRPDPEPVKPAIGGDNWVSDGNEG